MKRIFNCIFFICLFVARAFAAYKVTDVETTDNGSLDISLQLNEELLPSQAYGTNADQLQVNIEYLSLESPPYLSVYEDVAVSNTVVHLTITTDQWAVPSLPDEIFALEGGAIDYSTSESGSHDFSIYPPSVGDSNFSFSLYQRGNSTLHTTDAPLFDFGGADDDTAVVFQDGYLQFSFKPYPSPDGETVMYGLGNRRSAYRREPGTYTMLNRDPPALLAEDINGYTNHPVMWFLTDTSDNNMFHPVTATGAWFANASPSDIELTEDGRIIVKAINGAINMYFFAGPTLVKATQQYQGLVGFPIAVDINQFGWQNCRWGYTDLTEVYSIVQQHRDLGLPLDVQWLDIDAQNDYAAYTVDPINFPPTGLQEFQANLAADNIELVAIFDPGIKVIKDSDYEAYNDLESTNLALKVNDVSTGERDVQNSVWGGASVFPDFYNPETDDWIHTQLYNYFTNNVELQGIWNDMNEIAAFQTGECDDEGNQLTGVEYEQGLYYTFDPDSPPYSPGTDALQYRSLTMNAYSPGYGGMIELRNLYGTFMALRTRKALEELKPQTNPLILSRSTWSGCGKYTSQWLGDNFCEFSDMQDSFGQMLTSSLHGVPLIGADIPGFDGTPTEELYKRWLSAGSFYPFTRVHASDDSPDHTCWQTMYGEDACDIQRESITKKYTFMANMYSEMLKSHLFGGSITRPLQADWPNIIELYNEDKVFTYGGSLIAAPILDQGVASVAITLPYTPHGIIGEANRATEIYYDFSTLEHVSCVHSEGSDVCIVDAAAEYGAMPLFLRGGSIALKQEALERAKLTYAQDYTLVMALSLTSSSTFAESEGDFIVAADDVPIDPSSDSPFPFTHVYSTVTCNKGTCTLDLVTLNSNTCGSAPLLGNIVVIGQMISDATSATVTSSSVDISNQSLQNGALSFTLTNPIQFSDEQRETIVFTLN
ncbi:Glycoside hydrolase family 31 like protein [Aduncisulcus paluster]|uniref:Glycoside hydrolase family 31 like protein n=1 Tax=Aduncisulcus paluster TaxID=2918883 RepID=A0ABQ5JSU4_9EUKA|nr:Glycoside hydrolase family 31 like protein [Aduncisulcus paluster]